jgi:hypothetical protein
MCLIENAETYFPVRKQVAFDCCRPLFYPHFYFKNIPFIYNYIQGNTFNKADNFQTMAIGCVWRITVIFMAGKSNS